MDFPFGLPHFLTYRSIALLVNIGKVDRDLPHVSVLYVPEPQQTMMFDETCTLRSPVCLCLPASGLFSRTGKDYI